jgi:hypothetical protein
VPWDSFDLGLGSLSVGSGSNGGTSPGVVRATTAPGGKAAYELTVTPTAHASDAASSDSVYLWNYPQSYDGYANRGAVTWYHLRVMFPSSAFVPTTGEWNMVIVHHNDPGYTKFSCSQEVGNVAFDVTTDYPVVSGAVGQNAHLKLRLMGGNSCAPQRTWYDLGPLQYDHWYDLVYQVKWDPTTSGFFNLWLDGSQKSSYSGPTLYTRPDASVSYTWLDLVNYRLHANWNSTIYFGATKIGPTSGSVQ